MDFESLGFKAGLECHQQLSGSKLFCNCPTEIRKDSPDFSVRRCLRTSAGESGSVDRAAAYEIEKGKEYVYQGYTDSTCLVELDEEPPRPVNRDALRTVLQVCKLLHVDVVDEINVMRKIVVDGSNPSGFQRTMLVGRNGYIDVDGERVTIETVCLEEEACQIIERSDSEDVYNLSRMGIPLIEIATGPDIRNPSMCKDVAGRIGMILRSTEQVKRGIGSIRQDVNVSIDGGERVEIKGFQDLDNIPAVLEYEVRRQRELLEDGEMVESHVRRAESDHTTSYLRPMSGAERMYPETDVPKILTDLDVDVPELLSERAARFEDAFDIPDGFGMELVESGVDFATYMDRFDVDATFLAEFFTSMPKDIKSREGIMVEPEDHLDVVAALSDDRIPRSAVKEIVIRRERGESVDLSEYEKVSEEQIRSFVEEVVAEEPDAPVGAVMGRVMQEFGGNVEGSRAREIVQDVLE